jgi:hypothetical protein
MEALRVEEKPFTEFYDAILGVAVVTTPPN